MVGGEARLSLLRMDPPLLPLAVASCRKHAFSVCCALGPREAGSLQEVLSCWEEGQLGVFASPCGLWSEPVSMADLTDNAGAVFIL